ncbi:preprotein translocase subunit SecY [Limnoglobus roseus]|uniref:Protein translocase subunit SecY n=1 Tax=Limnoglobus roseus TaxID=2598579 RepID=A0A5C1ARW5_9BACT|nr:preprotein translocase subunit SecY [Limnoglobus roseus]QEL19974.1 preprotein translocase subunit SecY [Limnoglobus roseus]
MNWRRPALAIGTVLIVAGIALTFSNIGLTVLGFPVAYAALIAGIIGAVVGLAPEQLLLIFRIPELRRKIFITLIFLAAYRIGYYVPLPMVNHEKLQQKMNEGSGGTLGRVLGFVSMFSGGNLSNGCIFALGIMPYISASIIMQLLSSGVVPSLEKLRKEGQSGQKKINEYTRYLTVPICIAQSIMFVRYLFAGSPDMGGGGEGLGLLIPGYSPFFFGLSAVLIMTAGTLFMMWLGEQIDEYGIGNGISLIIMAGIVARIPDATGAMLFEPGTTKLKESLFTLGSATGDISFEKFVVLMMLFVAVVVGVIAITKAKRAIPMQSAKHVRGRRQFGGGRSVLPMKLNAAGVMPVIFASTLLIIPTFLFDIIVNISDASWAHTLRDVFRRGSGWTYNMFYILLIYVFCYFWVAITFNPKEISENLKEHGSFIPGYRPGKSTADYLEKVLMRITYVGAAFLAIIAIIPSIVQGELDVDPRIASFYGGTGLLIVISVALDLVSKINSHLVMRNFQGLTED